MRVTLEEPTNLSEVLNYNEGIIPRYGKGTMKGIFNCPCGRCVGNMLLLKDNNVVGWFDTTCKRCGRTINWSQADNYV